jgi:serine protease Do
MAEIGRGLLVGLLGLPVGSPLPARALTEVDIRRDATVAAIEQVMPSVVNIATSVRVNDPYQAFFRRFYGLGERPAVKEQINSVGSGVIIDEVGDTAYILTNLHVVRNADRVQVQLMDGRVYDAERLLSTSHKDLALLRIIRKRGEKSFRAVRLAKDDDLLLGETVIAIGNPFGLGGSVSRGILSAKNRRATPGVESLGYEDWLQTDADINPGNSGGPLINLRGELIGINVAIYEQGEGKGTSFAIPAKQISAALSDFFTLEYTADLWFGARLRGAPYPLSVREVQPGSPADRAGMRVGQMVIEVNGKPVSGLVEFNKLVAGSADRVARIVVSDNGTSRTVQAELMPLKDLLRTLLKQKLGLTTTPLADKSAATFQLKPEEGLLVSEGEGDSPGDRVPLQAGLVLVGIDGKAINDIVNAVNALGNKRTGDWAELAVIVPRRLSTGQVQLRRTSVSVPVR